MQQTEHSTERISSYN